MDHFTVTDCRPEIDDGLIPLDGFYYDVHLYPTKKLYRAALVRRDPRERKAESSEASCFHETTIMFGPEGKETKLPSKGAIYFHRERIDAEIVSHEAAHAALNLYRSRHDGSGDLGPNQTKKDAEREEIVALSIGRLTQAIADHLWDLVAWTVPTLGEGLHDENP